MDQETEVSIRNELKPGDMGYIIYLHGHLYDKEFGFSIDFETYVAAPFTELVQRKSDSERVWVVEQVGEIVGSMAISRYSDREAQLRWLLLHPRVRGRGIGKRLVEEGMAFSRQCGYETIFLCTVDVCRDAGRLYNALGFELTEEEVRKPLWGGQLVEQKYERKL